MKYVPLEHVENIVRRYCGASESIAVQDALYSAPELFRELDDVPNIQESESLEMRVKMLDERLARLRDEQAELARLRIDYKQLSIDLKTCADTNANLLSDLKSCASGQQTLLAERASLNERLEKQRVEIVRFQKGLRELLDEAP